MQLFGVTGGVGMGKTTSGELLRKLDVSVLDTDVIARELVVPGQPALEEIITKFGPSIRAADGTLDRKALAHIAFSDPAARADLEAILHPRIRATWEAGVTQWRSSGHSFGAVIIPLLFETKAAHLFDAVICIACSGATQWQRLRQRGWTDGEIRQRLEAQLSLEQKITQSEYVVWTDTTLEAHAAQLSWITKRTKESFEP